MRSSTSCPLNTQCKRSPMPKGRVGGRALAAGPGSASLLQPVVLLLLAFAGEPALHRPSQDQLIGVWRESLGHPEDAGTEAQDRLCVRPELGKVLSIQEEIGIPEVHVHQRIKVNMEASDILGSGGEGEIERIVGGRQCR